jgi:methionine-rich copper-binding protein CopC
VVDVKPLASVALVSFLALVPTLAFALPASAHDDLVESTPASGSTVTTLPDAFSITMNDAMLDLEGQGSAFGIEVSDADGLYYGDGCVTVDGATLSTAAAIGAPGLYSVTWQVVSGDGHPVSGEFEFQWAPSSEYAATEGTVTPGDCNGLYERAASTEEATDEPLAWPWIAGSAAIAIFVVILVVRALVGLRKNDNS